MPALLPDLGSLRPPVIVELAVTCCLAHQFLNWSGSHLDHIVLRAEGIFLRAVCIRDHHTIPHPPRNGSDKCQAQVPRSFSSPHLAARRSRSTWPRPLGPSSSGVTDSQGNLKNTNRRVQRFAEREVPSIAANHQLIVVSLKESIGLKSWIRECFLKCPEVPFLLHFFQK